MIQIVRIFIFTSLTICALSIQSAYASECPRMYRTYSDGTFTLSFSKDPQQSALHFAFTMKNISSQESYGGEVIYGNGFSIPHVLIKVPCAHDKQEVCSYEGTVYEINGNKTAYAFSVDENEENPLLFPQLGFQLHRQMKPYPNDVWHYTGCTKE